MMPTYRHKMAISNRVQVLNLYRSILRLSRTWKSHEGGAADSDTYYKEREYIRDEAKRLFRANKELQDTKEIKAAITEAESRIAMAMHYGNPWPRPTHIPQHTMLPPSLTKRRKKSDRILHQSKPAYIRSYDIGDEKDADKS